MISRNKNNHQRTYVHSWVSDSNLFRRHISQTYGRNWKKQQCPTSNALSIYASTSPEVQTPPMNCMTQKCMYGPIGRLHTGRNHPSSWTNALKISRPNWINYSKYELVSQTYSHIRHVLYKNYNNIKISSSALATKTLGRRSSNATTTSRSQ